MLGPGRAAERDDASRSALGQRGVGEITEHPAFHDAGAFGPAAKLLQLGLDRRSVTVYLLLLDEPMLDAPALSRELSLSATSIRSALGELERHALVRPSQSVPGAWRAISPEVALPHLVEHIEAELHERQAALAGLRTEIAAVVADYRTQREDRTAYVAERLDTIDAIVSRLEELGGAARSEILVMMPTMPSVQGRAESVAADAEAVARGVRLRTLHLDAHIEDPLFAEHLTQFVGVGALACTRPTLPVRMTIFDRHSAVIAIDPADPAQGAAVVHGRGLMSALCALFDECWESATPYTPQVADLPSGEALTRSEREILRLLARGLKDESVARHLGISVRTARRLISGLGERAGAESRFQLAIRARELGWL